MQFFGSKGWVEVGVVEHLHTWDRKVCLFDAADPHRLHKLTITKPGYRIETRTVKSTDSPVHLKLAKIPGAIVRPAGGTVAPKPSSDNAQTQPGFKDLPY